jgi:hypothetical protein
VRDEGSVSSLVEKERVQWLKWGGTARLPEGDEGEMGGTEDALVKVGGTTHLGSDGEENGRSSEGEDNVGDG